MHRSVKPAPDETTRSLPGDELIDRPIGCLTHAVTIHGSARDVWPWLAQMGAGTRAGWYSYDFLDNGRRPSASRILPELQSLSVGMLFPALPGVTEGFTVLSFEPDRSLLLGWQSPTKSLLVTWAFVLEEKPQMTRLIVRARGGSDYSFHRLPRWVSRHVIRVVHFVMQRKQLIEIAKRVEAAACLAARPSESTGVSPCNA